MAAERGAGTLVVVVALALGLSLVLVWRARPATDQGAPAAGSSVRATPVPPVPAASSAPTARSAGSSPPDTSAAPPSAARSLPDDPACPAGMVQLSGYFCPNVAHLCAEWVGAHPRRPGKRRTPAERRCRLYRNERICEGRPAQMHFCVDRFEYPNLAGARPVVLADYRQARLACRAEGKRLCETEEWTMACEGSRIWPYPYGIERDPTACNIDRVEVRPRPGALADPRGVAMELERIDQRAPSGSMLRCVSQAGVFDLTGNVAEWVHARWAESDPERSPSRMAGGHFGRVPATCRQSDGATRSHRSHQLGFRCCSDTLDGRPAWRLLDKTARLPLRRTLVDGAR